MTRIFTKRRVQAAVALLVLTVTGLGYAAWTTSGSGTAYSKAGTSQALSTVDVSASTTASLYPGATGDVLIRVSNPNGFAVRVTGVSLNGTNANITPDGSHAGCTTTGVSFTNQTGLTIDVPAGSATTATLTGAAAMSNASVDGCQGAVFSIPVNLTALSN
jgi:hypothetical protein